MFLELKNFLLDLIFPECCFFCNEEGCLLCEKCFFKILQKIKPIVFCIECENKIRDCQCNNKLIEEIFALGKYENKVLQKMLHLFKYCGIYSMSVPLAKILFIKAKKIIYKNESPVFLFVPMHKKKKLQRGFNQGELLVKELNRFIGKNEEYILLKKVRSTKSQMSLKREERLTNLKKAFGVKKIKKVPETVIIVDDVCTTGSTLREIAVLLKKVGVKKIYGLVIAWSTKD